MRLSVNSVSYILSNGIEEIWIFSSIADTACKHEDESFNEMRIVSGQKAHLLYR